MAYATYFSVNLINSNVAKTKGSRSATQEAKYLKEGDKDLGCAIPSHVIEKSIATDRVDYLLNGKKQPPNFNKPPIPKLGSKNPHTSHNDKLRTLSDLQKQSEAVFGDVSDFLKQSTDSKFREDLTYYSVQNMPCWATEESEQTGRSPELIFFEASQYFETYNNIKNHDPSVNFYEIKFTLPNEASHQQKVNIINDVIKKEGLDKFTYIISMHEKFAALEPNIHNDHVHIMFSTRMIDGIERDKEHFFSDGKTAGRYKPKNPDKGPCQKSDKFTSRDRKKNLKRVRKTIADTINKFYKDNKIDKEVFSGTKIELLEYAIKIGDMEIAEIALLEAQTHLGYQKCNNPKNPDTIKIMKLKEQMQAIRDRYAEIRYEESLNPIPQIEKSEPIKDYTLDELIQQRTLLYNEIKTLKNEYLKIPTEPYTIDLNKTQLDIVILEDAIRENRRRMSTNPKTHAINKFFTNTELKDDAIKHSLNVKNLDKLLDRIVGTEIQIANNNKCSFAQRENLNRQYRLVEKLQTEIEDFTERYVTPNLDKIEKIEQKLINANIKKTSNIEILFQKIYEIQNQLPNLDIQSALETKFALTNERITLGKIKNNLTESDDIANTLYEEIKIATQEKSIITQEIAIAQTMNNLKNSSTAHEESSPIESTKPIIPNESLKIFINEYEFTTAAESHKIAKKELGNLQGLLIHYDSEIAKTKESLISIHDAEIQAKEFFIKNNSTLFGNDTQKMIDVRCASPRIADKIKKITNDILLKNFPIKDQITKLTAKQIATTKQINELKPLTAKLEKQAEFDAVHAKKTKCSERVYKIPKSRIDSNGGAGALGGGGSSSSPRLNVAKALANLLPSDPKVVALTARTESDELDLAGMTDEQQETAIIAMKIEQGH